MNVILQTFQLEPSYFISNRKCNVCCGFDGKQEVKTRGEKKKNEQKLDVALFSNII